MRRILVTIAVAAAMLTGGLAFTTATASAASAGWCDGVRSVPVNAAGNYVRQPYHRATGSRSCTLAEGASGPAVTALQQALKSCNFASRLTVDGDFGPNTRTAVFNAQQEYRIGADGIYGPISRVTFLWPDYFSNGKPTGRCVRVG